MSDVNLKTLRHSASHVLAMAVLEMFPEAHLGMGPAIEDGFYYDFELPRTLIPEDLPILERKMKKFTKKAFKFEKVDIPAKDALAKFREARQPYKVALTEDIMKEQGDDASVSIYKTGNFVDLCAGPHVANTGEIKFFKLQKIAGAYWKGSEENEQLQRIYGTAFATQKELDDYLARQEEMKKRDHRLIGKKMDLFSFHEEAPGAPFWHPKGKIMLNIITDFWRQEHAKAGYSEIQTPFVFKRKLWEQSGHWKLYKDNMYAFKSNKKEELGLKPMNCPGGILYYKEKPHSYHELPLRHSEIGIVHRQEDSGALAGLLRVMHITQDDAHIYMAPDQAEAELKRTLKFGIKILHAFGFRDLIFELSTRDEKHKDKYLGDDKVWDKAESTLAKVLKSMKLGFKEIPGEAKFYGPAIDVRVKDSLGRQWQITTIQFDFNLPERFKVEYIDKDGQKKRPLMIHRALLGALERFIGVLLEHHAGLPLWLSPVQVKVIPVSDKFNKYAGEIAAKLEDKKIRVEQDLRKESVGRKIRDAEMELVPYMIVLGEKEKKAKKVNIRERKTNKQNMVGLDGLVKKLREEISAKK